MINNDLARRDESLRAWTEPEDIPPQEERSSGSKGAQHRKHIDATLGSGNLRLSATMRT
jgi:hypothetical protein